MVLATRKRRGIFFLIIINVVLLGFFRWRSLQPNSARTTSLGSTAVYRPLNITQFGIYVHDTEKLRPLFVFKQKPWRVEKTIAHGNNCQLSKGDEQWGMVFVVKSAASNIERRRVIRSTWGAVKKFDDALFEVVFVLGESKNYEEENAKIIKENAKHGDILQYNEEDTPRFVPEKVLAGMQWASQLPQQWFYSSIDDDIAVNFANLVDYFESLATNHTLPDHSIRFSDMPIICIYNYQEKDPPSREPHSKWYMPFVEYPKKFWPVYCRGGMYATSQSMVNKLYEISRKTLRLYLDDVWITGFMRLKLRRGNTNIVAAPFSVKNDGELQRDLDFKNLIVKHFWGNIKGKNINVTASLMETWAQHQELFSHRIKCRY